MAGPLDGDVDDEDALRQQQEHHVDEISRGVFDEDGGEGFYSEDEDEEVDDPEDWVKMGVEDQEEVEAVLGEVRDNFQDEVDLWDTTMVAEYAEDIFAYMEELELKTMPNPRYMESQTEIEWSMRTTLIDWLLQVHLRYHMLPETLWIAVNIVDRFLSVRVVSLVKLQLVGVTAMFIAAKYEEILAPSVDEFVYMTENGYTKDEILKGERIVLQTLDFNVSSYCSPYSWMRRISKADDYDIQTRTLSKFLIEATLLDHRFLRAKPSMIAAIGMFLANRMLGKQWNESFVFYSSFTEAQLIPGAEFLIEQLAQPEFEQQYVSKKYASKKFLKASTFARDWARTHLALED
ncbi:cyclin-like protein [Mrakia frigida]|uniref:cyclin family protein n=1 Tax=Mrakia frigida TaxID=29902 RepID=UPI003FCC0A9D